MNEKGKMKIVVIVLSVILLAIIGLAVIEAKNQSKKLETFNQYFNSSEPKLIYFARDTCYYCNLLAPARQEILDNNNVDYYYVDTDNISEALLNQMLDKLGITSFGTPTLAIVQNGEVVYIQSGVFSTDTDNVDELTAFLQKYSIIEASE
ncbi:MAG: thioredoxin family protein [Bacilli bacterium]|nr:thioredoxin family protein [Bacilli bacterium]